jgi:hypothetical protein
LQSGFQTDGKNENLAQRKRARALKSDLS